MRIVAIYPGRFQPPTSNHYKVYQYLAKKFGKNNVYISTSNKMQQKSPFSFNQKQLILNKMFGINKSNIINNNQPYRAQNFNSVLNKENTVLVYALTQKDNRLSVGRYFKGNLPKDPKPYSQQAYWENVPYMNNKILGQQISGTSVRSLLRSNQLSLEQKKKIFTKLYGKFDNSIFQMMLTKLGASLIQRISLQQLLKNIRTSGRSNLQQGGKSGHLLHPFQNNGLTFNNFKQLITNILTGQVTINNSATIKYDGKNIYVTWKDGKLIAARNGGQTKNFGENGLDIMKLKDFFSGRGNIRDAFVFSAISLTRAFKKLSNAKLKQIFNQGHNWINLQVIYDKSQHNVPYDRSMLIFHSLVQVDEKGNVLNSSTTRVSDVYSSLVQVNANIQKHFSIQGPSYVTLPKSQNFQKDKSYFLGKLKSLQSQYNLKGNDTLLDYHRAYWTNLIKNYASNMQYNISDQVLQGLLIRWANLDKSYSVNIIKKQCDNPKFLQWILKFDKNDHKRQYKSNCYKWQLLFLELGAKVLKNLSTFMISNPDLAIQKIRKQLQNSIKQIQNTKDINLISKMQAHLNKIKSIGGIQAIVPTQGIVFTYKDNTYKLTGVFAPLNMITGMLKFARK